MSKPCLLPFIHLETDTVGNVRPCCMWRGEPMGNLNNQSIDEVWNGERYSALREQFRTSKQLPSGCEFCWRAEQGGMQSKRQNDNARFDHHQHGVTLDAPVYLDLKLGSICNIKCRTCSSQHSQKWAADEKIIYGEQRFPTVLNWLDDDSQFWKDLEKIAPTIEFIDFTGGEPFLVKGHWQLLEYLVEHGYAANIKIHYNTNGTVLPKPEQRDLWLHFEWVETMFSFDGIGSKFEYLRHPARWDKVLHTFNTILDEAVTHTTLCYTVSLMNVLDMREFAEWAPVDVYWNMLHGPEYYSIRNLPENVKDIIADKIDRQDVIDYMYAGEHSKGLWEDFVKTTKQIDIIRNENFSTVFPELSQLINI